MTQSKETVFLIKFCAFYNKNKILTTLFIVKYYKITLEWWVVSVVGVHNQQVFCMFKWGKKLTKATKNSAQVQYRSYLYRNNVSLTIVCGSRQSFFKSTCLSTFCSVFCAEKRFNQKNPWRCQDIQHNDTYHNDIGYYDTQHNGIRHKDVQHIQNTEFGITMLGMTTLSIMNTQLET